MPSKSRGPLPRPSFSRAHLFWPFPLSDLLQSLSNSCFLDQPGAPPVDLWPLDGTSLSHVPLPVPSPRPHRVAWVCVRPAGCGLWGQALGRLRGALVRWGLAQPRLVSLPGFTSSSAWCFCPSVVPPLLISSPRSSSRQPFPEISSLCPWPSVPMQAVGSAPGGASRGGVAVSSLVSSPSRFTL